MIIETAHRIQQIEEYYFSTKLRAIAKANANGANILNLGIGNPDMDPPKSVINAMKDSLTIDTAHQYQPYKGISKLRVAMADWYQNTYNVELDADKNILPLLGSKEGIMHLSMSFLQEGDEVLVPNPGYPAYASTAKLAGARVLPYPLDEENNYLPNIDFLRKFSLRRVKIMWINYTHMPTGAIVSREKLEELVKFAKEENILLAIDNPYGFILNENAISIFSIPGADEVAVELNSLSKMYNMAGWRVGFMAGKESYINEVLKFKSNMDSGMFLPIQKAAIEALQQDNTWKIKLNNIYTKRRIKAWKLLDRLNCTYNKNSAGIFVWAKIPDDKSSAEEYSEEILKIAKVFITPGFIFGSNGDRYLRISLCHKEAIYEEAISRIG